MNLHCPCCHANFSVDAIVQDEAARELLALRPTLPKSLFPYLSLFRPAKQALSWDRALKLARQVLELEADSARLEEALAETVAAIRSKRAEGGNMKPMGNHNYLKRVLESMPGAGYVSVPVADPAAQTSPPSRTLSALAKLEHLKR